MAAAHGIGAPGDVDGVESLPRRLALSYSVPPKTQTFKGEKNSHERQLGISKPDAIRADFRRLPRSAQRQR